MFFEGNLKKCKPGPHFHRYYIQNYYTQLLHTPFHGFAVSLSCFLCLSLGPFSRICSAHCAVHKAKRTGGNILVPRAYDPSGLRQESRALGATISGMRHRCRCAVSQITRIRLFPLFFHNGCSQSSRFLPQARRIVGSGDENGEEREYRVSLVQVQKLRQLDQNPAVA